MSGWYELSKSSNGQFKFVLKAGNGEVILTSELYTAKAGANNGISSVQTNSQSEANFAKETAKNDKPYFNLKAANHQIIGTSQMYSSTSSRDNGIRSVMENGKTSTIKDLTAG
ncbi:YegP family protein [Shewanella phaeophyticola]|uniref:YegP family protein n=1 Tax=Shewanella phaeophyticola TaxID=2978345 RepID=A0ABT2NY03_9GAMM|nr:YegP family protein [Shewanella sp. KJ10-1]MCT8985274.1 YegP family protein [Shewanella sp. KJ10-1]